MSAILPEQIESYRKQMRAFREKFGREMGPDDPFFFDPDAPVPQCRDPRDADFALDLLAKVMVEAGVSPAVIYAFKRTGGLFPGSQAPLSASEQEEWNGALDEYYRRIGATPKQ